MTEFSAARPALAIYSGGPNSAATADQMVDYSVGASATNVANRIYYTPIRVPFTFPVKRWAWGVGSSGSGANMDIGIYSFGGTLLASSGSQAKSGSSILNTANASPEFRLSPGRYYLAFQCDSTTNRIWAFTVNLQTSKLAGCYVQDAGGFGLASNAATMTPSTFLGTLMPLFGVVRW